MQFGFNSRKGAADVVFVVKQLQEKCMEKRTNLYFTFVDLEKAHGRLSRELVYWCLCKRNILKKLIKLIGAT